VPAGARVVEPPTRPLSFSAAKKELRRLYAEGPQRTLYADCVFEGWKVDWSRCCFVPERASRKRLEWEHIVPAAAFGRGFVEWTEGHPACVDARNRKFHGRKCARRASEAFRHAEGDMHNLVPSIGEINERRGHAPPGLVEGEPRMFGSCDVEIDTLFEPREGARGDVARAYLYMAAVYPSMSLAADERAMFMRWHAADPPDDMERRRNAFIEEAQGNHNPWID
jgi:deoxyribonuclease-1